MKRGEYECSECGRSFQTSFGLKRHRTMTHQRRDKDDEDYSEGSGVDETPYSSPRASGGRSRRSEKIFDRTAAKGSSTRSVDLLISELTSADPLNNPFLYHKPPGCRDTSVGFLGDEIELTILQTPEQKRLMTEFGGRGLILDSAFGANQRFKYRLFSLFVSDEDLVCFPVAHLVTSSDGSLELIQFFFKKLSVETPNLSPKMFISDSPEYLLEGFSEVYPGAKPKWLLSIWQRKQDWWANLRLIHERSKREWTKKTLKSLLSQRSLDKFNRDFENLCNFLESESESKEFGRRLRADFDNSSKIAASLCAPSVQIADRQLRGFHKYLNFPRLSKRSQERLDFILIQLLNIEKVPYSDCPKIDEDNDDGGRKTRLQRKRSLEDEPPAKVARAGDDETERLQALCQVVSDLAEDAEDDVDLGPAIDFLETAQKLVESRVRKSQELTKQREEEESRLSSASGKMLTPALEKKIEQSCFFNPAAAVLKPLIPAPDFGEERDFEHDYEPPSTGVKKEFSAEQRSLLKCIIKEGHLINFFRNTHSSYLGLSHFKDKEDIISQRSLLSLNKETVEALRRVLTKDAFQTLADYLKETWDSWLCALCETANATDHMVACNSCETWFHFHCVGMTWSELKNAEEWQCMTCTGNL